MYRVRSVFHKQYDYLKTIYFQNVFEVADMFVKKKKIVFKHNTYAFLNFQQNDIFFLLHLIYRF